MQSTTTQNAVASTTNFTAKQKQAINSVLTQANAKYKTNIKLVLLNFVSLQQIATITQCPQNYVVTNIHSVLTNKRNNCLLTHKYFSSLVTVLLSNMFSTLNLQSAISIVAKVKAMQS